MSYQQKSICSPGSGEEAPLKSPATRQFKFQLEQFTHPQPSLFPHPVSISKHGFSPLWTCTPVSIPSKPNNFQELASTKLEHNKQTWHLTSQADSQYANTKLNIRLQTYLCCELSQIHQNTRVLERQNPRNSFTDGSGFWLNLLFPLNCEVWGFLVC